MLPERNAGAAVSGIRYLIFVRNSKMRFERNSVIQKKVVEKKDVVMQFDSSSVSDYLQQQTKEHADRETPSPIEDP
jgi:hypothetical protein